MTDGEVEGMDDLQKRLDAIKDHRKMLGLVGLRAVAIAKTLVPRKTGNLGRTIRLGTVTNTEAQVIAGGQGGVGYAQAVEFGSKPHVIVPRYKSVLAWGGARRLSGSLKSGASATVFAKRVNHPGTKAKPFLRPAAAQAVKEVGVEGIVTAWNEAA